MKKSLWVVVLIIASRLCVRADSSVILVDGSGSMAGFFTTGSIHSLHGELTSALQAAGVDNRSYAFKHRLLGGKITSETAPFDASVAANGSITLIDKAYEQATSEHVDSGILWMVTDNVQDPQSSEEERGDIARFYRSIENDPRVYRVYFFIRTLDFNGPLYRQGGRERLVENYRGKRSLIIYAILLQPQMQAAFDRAAHLFEKGGLGATLVKGLSSAPIRMVDNPELTSQTESKIAANNRLILRNGRLSTTANQVFHENEPIHASFVIGFESHAENIKISQPDIHVEIIQDFGATSEDMLKVQPEIHVTPARLPGDLLPSAEMSNVARTWVQVDVDFPKGIRFSHTPGALWRDIWRRSGSRYEGSIKVAVRATKSAFDFSPKMIRDYNAGPEYFTQATEAAQSRIPELDSLFRQLNSRDSEEVEIVTQPFIVGFPVQYPLYPLAFLFGAVALVAVAGNVVWKSAHTTGYSLETLGPRHYQLVKQQRTKNDLKIRRGLDDAFQPDVILASASPAVPLQIGWFGAYSIRESDQVLGVIRRRWRVAVQAGNGYLVDGKTSIVLRPGQSFSFTERLTDTRAGTIDVEKLPNRESRSTKRIGADQF